VQAVIENGLRYYEVESKRFPSVTTIIRAILGEPEELKYWKSVTPDWERIVRERGIIGQAIHHRILNRYSIRQLEPPTIYLPWKQTDKWLEELAYRAELAELMWNELDLQVEDAMCEHVMVSYRHRYGGMADLIGVVNNKRAILEVKTGRKSEEHKLQIGAYYILAEENGIELDAGIITYIHPFPEENEELKSEILKLNKLELKWYGHRFLDLVKLFYNCRVQDK